MVAISAAFAANLRSDSASRRRRPPISACSALGTTDLGAGVLTLEQPASRSWRHSEISEEQDFSTQIGTTLGVLARGLVAGQMTDAARDHRQDE